MYFSFLKVGNITGIVSRILRSGLNEVNKEIISYHATFSVVLFKELRECRTLSIKELLMMCYLLGFKQSIGLVNISVKVACCNLQNTFSFLRQ
jgi:hypothetical protein